MLISLYEDVPPEVLAVLQAIDGRVFDILISRGIIGRPTWKGSPRGLELNVVDASPVLEIDASELASITGEDVLSRLSSAL